MDDDATPNRALADAIASIGSQSALARLLGISQNAVSKWVRLGRSLPDKHVLKVEAATGVPKERLRPDLYRREPVPATDAAMEPAR